MTPPLIGITTYAQNENEEVTLPACYIESVRRAGGIPVLVAPGESRVEQLLGRLEHAHVVVVLVPRRERLLDPLVIFGAGAEQDRGNALESMVSHDYQPSS